MYILHVIFTFFSKINRHCDIIFLYNLYILSEYNANGKLLDFALNPSSCVVKRLWYTYLFCLPGHKQ